MAFVSSARIANPGHDSTCLFEPESVGQIAHDDRARFVLAKHAMSEFKQLALPCFKVRVAPFIEDSGSERDLSDHR